MSTSYGLHCATCKKDGPVPFTRGAHVVRELVKWWPKLYPIVQAAKRIESVYISVEIVIDWHSDEEEDVQLIQFMKEHNEHEWLLLDEYGYTHPLEEGKW